MFNSRLRTIQNRKKRNKIFGLTGVSLVLILFFSLFLSFAHPPVEDAQAAEETEEKIVLGAEPELQEKEEDTKEQSESNKAVEEEQSPTITEYIEPEEQEEKNRGNVLGAFTSFLASPTPTATLTPTPTLTFTPSPTLTPTDTPTPTPIPPTETPAPTATVMPTRVPASPVEIDEYFQKYSGEYGVEIELLRKIAHCESGYNAQAINGPYAGMYQFHEQTWISTRQHMGMDSNPDLRFNPEEAIRTAAFKISFSGPSAWHNCAK